MDKKKLKAASLLTAAAATTVYSVIRGIGIFNRPRFRSQHEAVSKYVETHYPGALYSPIHQTDFGWSTVIKTGVREKILLMITQTNDGIFIFKEKIL